MEEERKPSTPCGAYGSTSLKISASPEVSRTARIPIHSSLASASAVVERGSLMALALALSSSLYRE
ncbi:MAG: hypothetical protein ACFFC7_28825 [Candidatus Hermodarchaeota archaeon]